MKLVIAISKVSDGNMLIKSDKENPEVISNRKIFLEKNNIDINQTTLVSTIYEGNDFCRYHEIGTNEKAAGMFDDKVLVADALVTKEMNHALFLPIADCVGAVIYDTKKNILMLTHLGRHALEQNGGYKSVRYLIEDFGCKQSDLKVFLSPAPGVESYPLYNFDNRSLKDVTIEQFESAGVTQKNINVNPADTTKDTDYFSHSKFLKGNQQTDGRFAIVAMMTNA